jgi:hypothetical protein
VRFGKNPEEERNMKKSLAFAIAALSFATMFFGSNFVGKLYAADLEQTGTCSNATLKGSWGYYRTGTNNNVEIAGPYAGVGIMFADGNGNAKRRQTVSFNGSYEKNTSSFQYEVKSDCTGRLLTGSGNEFAWFVIVDGGKEFYLISKNNQTIY